MNPFSALWSSLKHLADQARRLGDAFGSMADQVEQRSLGMAPASALPAPEANGHVPESSSRRGTKVVGAGK